MLYEPIIYESNTYFNNNIRGTLTEINIADIHFGVSGIDPYTHYSILHNQFIEKIYNINFDILNINGDIFDRRFPSTSNVIKYALMFINECAYLCRVKNASLVVINGTKSHDDGQLSLLYQYIMDPTLDIRIIEKTQFIYVKGSKKLCIPEEYGKGKKYYDYFLKESGFYDSVNMHGTLVGSIYGASKSDLESKKAPIFSIEDFDMCRGPIVAGHVHTGGCFNKYAYYCSSPLRFRFDEEEPKGFLIVLNNLDTHEHYTHFEEITSFRYDTITIDSLLNSAYNDPNNIKAYIDSLQANGIDHIRIIFNNIPIEIQEIIKKNYQNDNSIVFKEKIKQKEKNKEYKTILEEKYNDLGFLLDSSLSEYDKFVRYINYNKGENYITVDKIKSILGNI